MKECVMGFLRVTFLEWLLNTKKLTFQSIGRNRPYIVQSVKHSLVRYYITISSSYYYSEMEIIKKCNNIFEHTVARDHK